MKAKASMLRRNRAQLERELGAVHRTAKAQDL
jgi:hypothetical protein